MTRVEKYRLSKRGRRVFVIAGITLLGALFVFFAHPFSFSAKAVSDQALPVHLVSGHSQIEMKKSMPEKYNGKERKIAYLTFDDGPSVHLTAILDILADNDIKATFFMVGPNITPHQEEMKRLVEEGHYPGLHSMTHNYQKLYNEGKITDEMKQVRDIVRDVTGVTANLTRCPYGSMPGLTKELRDEMTAAGFKEWDWTVDSNDWRLKGNPNAVTQTIMEQATKNVEIILMHEQPQTVQALPDIIAGLRAKGYEFEVYSESAHFPVNFWKDNRL